MAASIGNFFRSAASALADKMDPQRTQPKQPRVRKHERDLDAEQRKDYLEYVDGLNGKKAKSFSDWKGN
jgi:hypothetical protein